MSTAIEIVRSFYANLAGGDIPAVLGVLHPELQWTEAEGFPYYGGTWRHPQDVVDKLLKPLARDWDEFSARASDFIVDGDRVVSLGIYSGINKATKKALRAPFAHVWRIAEGKLAHFEMYTDTLLVRQAMER
jgi:ketosteroid isomerase-like protein